MQFSLPAYMHKKNLVSFRHLIFIHFQGNLMRLSGLFRSLKQSEIYKPLAHPNFSQNLDENLKVYLVWPNLICVF